MSSSAMPSLTLVNGVIMKASGMAADRKEVLFEGATSQRRARPPPTHAAQSCATTCLAPTSHFVVLFRRVLRRQLRKSALPRVIFLTVPPTIAEVRLTRAGPRMHGTIGKEERMLAYRCLVSAGFGVGRRNCLGAEQARSARKPAPYCHLLQLGLNEDRAKWHQAHSHSGATRQGARLEACKGGWIYGRWTAGCRGARDE